MEASANCGIGSNGATAQRCKEQRHDPCPNSIYKMTNRVITSEHQRTHFDDSTR